MIPQSKEEQTSCSDGVAQVMLGSTMTKLVSVFAVGLPLCLLGGLAYSAASGKSLLQGCLQAYAALYKIPGGPQAVPLISIPITACLQPVTNTIC